MWYWSLPGLTDIADFLLPRERHERAPREDDSRRGRARHEGKGRKPFLHGRLRRGAMGHNRLWRRDRPRFPRIAARNVRPGEPMDRGKATHGGIGGRATARRSPAKEKRPVPAVKSAKPKEAKGASKPARKVVTTRAVKPVAAKGAPKAGAVRAAAAVKGAKKAPVKNRPKEKRPVPAVKLQSLRKLRALPNRPGRQ